VAVDGVVRLDEVAVDEGEVERGLALDRLDDRPGALELAEGLFVAVEAAVEDAEVVGEGRLFGVVRAVYAVVDLAGADVVGLRGGVALGDAVHAGAAEGEHGGGEGVGAAFGGDPGDGAVVVGEGLVVVAAGRGEHALGVGEGGLDEGRVEGGAGLELDADVTPQGGLVEVADDVGGQDEQLTDRGESTLLIADGGGAGEGADERGPGLARLAESVEDLALEVEGVGEVGVVGRGDDGGGGELAGAGVVAEVLFGVGLADAGVGGGVDGVAEEGGVAAAVGVGEGLDGGDGVGDGVIVGGREQAGAGGEVMDLSRETCEGRVSPTKGRAP
jgi:hypothetical protein